MKGEEVLTRDSFRRFNFHQIRLYSQPKTVQNARESVKIALHNMIYEILNLFILPVCVLYRGGYAAARGEAHLNSGVAKLL